MEEYVDSACHCVFTANHLQMGPPPNPEQLLEMMDNPMFLQQMNEAMNNPDVINMMQQNPMVRNNPMIQEMLRNPEMRRMMFNPDMMRMQLQMQRAMGPGGSAGGSSFPMPGATNTTPQDGTNTQNQPLAGIDPLQQLMGAGAGGTGANPFANLFPSGTNAPGQNATNATSTNSTTGSTQPTNGTPESGAPANPFASLFGTPGSDPQQANPIAEAARNLMQNPEAMRAAMQMMGTMNGSSPSANPFAAMGGAQPPSNTGTSSPPAANPFAALFGPGGGFGSGMGFGAPPPQDNRPPEEVYESQLRQLNEMGFYEFERNVAALRRSGGNVQSAIDFLLGGGS
jgi:ubiquilin